MPDRELIMAGLNVVVTTDGHPVLPKLRLHSAQFNLSVKIVNNVWIGSGVQIMPVVIIAEAAYSAKPLINRPTATSICLSRQ